MDAKIYALMSGQLILYIGSTVRNLCDREKGHKTNPTASIRDIPKDIEWTIKLLEVCKISDRYIREGYYYRLLNPLYNKQEPGLSRKESIKKYNDARAVAGYYTAYRTLNKDTINHTRMIWRNLQK